MVIADVTPGAVVTTSSCGGRRRGDRERSPLYEAREAKLLLYHDADFAAGLGVADDGSVVQTVVHLERGCALRAERSLDSVGADSHPHHLLSVVG